MPERKDIEFQGELVSIRGLADRTGIAYDVLFQRLRRAGWPLEKTLTTPMRPPRKLVPHGKTGTRVYNAWNGLVQRCTNPKQKYWDRYGGRGIKVADEWLDFKNFYHDMGEPPSPNHEIDRIDNDGPYCKSNCRWLEHKPNSRNRFYENLVEFEGKKVSVAELAERFGINYDTLTHRIRKAGWSVEKAVSTKPRPNYDQSYKRRSACRN